MTWVRFDDQADDHPKIAGLTDQAFRWWFRAFCYSARFLLDGVLPEPFLSRVPKRVVAELVAAGLWEQSAGRMFIHDYHDYQPDRATVQAKRQQAAERVKRHRNGVTRREETALLTREIHGLKRGSNHAPDPDPDLRTPFTPLKGELVIEKDPTRAERVWAEKILKDRRGVCPHEPVQCTDEYACIGRLVGDKRHSEREGLRQAANS